MNKKRIILAAAVMSMSLIAFMSMNTGRAAFDMYSDSSTMFAVDHEQNRSPADAVAMLEQWK